MSEKVVQALQSAQDLMDTVELVVCYGLCPAHLARALAHARACVETALRELETAAKEQK